MENKRIASPSTSIETACAPLPFHSLRAMPQKLEKSTLSDIRMLHEKASRTGVPGEKAPSHFESEELRVPQSAGQRTEEQVHGQPTAFHRHVFTARTVLAVLAQAVGRIGQESAEGNQQDHGQSGDERIGARGLHSGADRRSGVESQREAALITPANKATSRPLVRAKSRTAARFCSSLILRARSEPHSRSRRYRPA